MGSLRQQLAADAAAADAAANPKPFQEFPCTKYRAVPVSVRYPNGYQARRFEAEEAARLGPEWKDSPDDLS